MADLDAALGYCSHAWYGPGGDFIDGCAEGGAHLCDLDANHDGKHLCIEGDAEDLTEQDRTA